MNRLPLAAVADLPSAGAADSSLDLYRPERYRIREIDGQLQRRTYEALLEQTYGALGFPLAGLRPTDDSRCFLLEFGAQTAATFRLTPVDDGDHHFRRVLPRATRADGAPLRLLEVNNVIVVPRFRATIALGLLLRHSALHAAAHGYDFIVGLTRYQVLRHFVEFGVVPVDHEPLHLLGRDDLLDFTIYYDTASPASCAYIEQRAQRYFHQQYVLRSIDEKYGRAQRRLQAAVPAAA
ncbi:hypothetical protein [Solimonas variicoloris]|uniref:hypothetical protein n=1 Tax=Solimonas variicoloris TaxID=254408 RepID=UPI0003636C13|nr:hypothetical protein [Solimonas variicoloris]